LHKRRQELGFMQKQVAARLSVNTRTYFLWEHDRTVPTVRYYPAILGYLGYDPFPCPTTLPAQLASKRRELGLSIKRAAELLGVDEGTFARWESGEWKPRMSNEVVRRLLALPREFRSVSGYCGRNTPPPTRTIANNPPERSRECSLIGKAGS
jgi:transcriptional regulator with XRE-family HTH domain